jgi:hypothetical protein
MVIRQRLAWKAVVFSMSLVAAGLAWSQETFNVTALRLSKVTLYKDCNMEKGIPFTREDLEKRKPWQATKDPNTSVHYWVTMDGEKYCVKAFAVETDRSIPVAREEECNTRITGRPPKTGAVRGIGESCADGAGTPPAGAPGGGRPPGPPAGTPGNRPR